jgi:GTP-binding protein EngB required for normal cell division
MLMEDLWPFMQRRQVSTVALIGEQRAGKTTLLSSIYQQFCRGRFAGLSFAGSETLVGFAKRHHLALLSSGRADATVPRTSRNDPVSFFHLCLQRQAGDLVDLILSDRSGEAYGAARTDTSLIPGLIELPLANRACFLLDGAKLASKDDRPAYSRHFKQLIHALHDNGALKHVATVEVLATKFDVTNSQADVAQQTDYLDKYEKQLISEFADAGLQIQTHRICALPKADHKVGFKGLDQLIQRWTEKAMPPTLTPRAIGDTPRQVDRLLAHVEGGV